MADVSVQVFYEATPNPQAMKFVVDREISRETASFSTPDQSTRSPLARKVFGFPWAAGVSIGSNFVTVTKQDWVDWSILAEPLSDMLRDHIQNGEAILLPASALEPDSASDTPVVALIKRVIDDEIRPAVAMDGGDIEFSHFADGIVYLYMRGACSGCPSATMTLKEGIETRLMRAVAEVKEVVAL